MAVGVKDSLHIELCSHYITTGFPHFNPKCLLGHKAGIWCHKNDSKHYCKKYYVEELYSKHYKMET